MSNSQQMIATVEQWAPSL